MRRVLRFCIHASIRKSRRPQTSHCGCRAYSPGRFFSTRRVSQCRQRQWKRAISVTARHRAVEGFRRPARQTLARICRVLAGVANDALNFFRDRRLTRLRTGRFVDPLGFHNFQFFRIPKPRQKHSPSKTLLPGPVAYITTGRRTPRILPVRNGSSHRPCSSSTARPGTPARPHAVRAHSARRRSC